MGASPHGEENAGTGHRAQSLEPLAWANPPGCCSPPPACWGLTFHSARTSRASSRRPPRVLPTMIQMGICESSCLEISNVICKGRRAPGPQHYCSGAWVAAGWQAIASAWWYLLEGWVAPGLRRPQSTQPLHSRRSS